MVKMVLKWQILHNLHYAIVDGGGWEDYKEWNTPSFLGGHS